MKLIISLISLLSCMSLFAYDFKTNGLYFSIISEKDNTCALAEPPIPYSGVLTIPSKVEYSGKTMGVVEIVDNCFKNNTVIVGITIPSSIRKIGEDAFRNCTSLTTVKWEGDMILSRGIFAGCTNLKNISYKSICKDIPNSAFSGCSSLSIDLSEVKYISPGAFYSCKSLNIVDLSSLGGLKESRPVYLGYHFANCGKISLFKLGSNYHGTFYTSFPPDFLTNCEIDSLVFEESTNPLILGDYEINIMRYFYGSKVFDNISVRSLYLGRLLKPRWEEDDLPFCNKDIRTVKIGKLVKSLPSVIDVGYFQNCKNLTKVVFESSEISLGINCFMGTNIKEIYFLTWNNRLNLNQEPGFSDEIYNNAILYVPYGSKDEFKITSPWSNFKNIVELDYANAEKIEINVINTTLQVGDTLKLTRKKYPEYSPDTVQWKSSNLDVATISRDGIVKAIAPGKTIITAICGKVSSSCEVTVLEPNIDIEFSDNKLTVITEGYRDESSIKIFSVFGECICKKSVKNGDEIDLLKLNPGTYIVQVISGNMNISKRIVKSNK